MTKNPVNKVGSSEKYEIVNLAPYDLKNSFQIYFLSTSIEKTIFAIIMIGTTTSLKNYGKE